MNTINIGGEEYPIRYNFSALRQVAKLAGKSALGDILQLTAGLQLDHVPELARIGLEVGMKREKDKRKVPTLAEIEEEMDERMDLLKEILERFTADLGGKEEPETATANEGN